LYVWRIVYLSTLNLIFKHSCSHEYQMIMSVIWKRINDTGKNWRHVYKVLTNYFKFYMQLLADAADLFFFHHQHYNLSASLWNLFWYLFISSAIMMDCCCTLAIMFFVYCIYCWSHFLKLFVSVFTILSSTPGFDSTRVLGGSWVRASHRWDQRTCLSNISNSHLVNPT